ncbi:unnamed protein product, partial [Rotaria magnacalcarata]
VVNDNSSEKVIVDEQTHKSLSPPLSLSSTSENTTTTTTTTSTSEDDFDDKDSNDLAVVIDNHVPTDCNQLIV